MIKVYSILQNCETHGKNDGVLDSDPSKTNAGTNFLVESKILQPPYDGGANLNSTKNLSANHFLQSKNQILQPPDDEVANLNPAKKT